MKLLCLMAILTCLLPIRAIADDSYLHPFEGIDSAKVLRIEIAVAGVADPIRIKDRKWIARFIDSISPKDYPSVKGPMDFSMPGELAEVALLGRDGGALVSTTLYGAWNLLLSGKGKPRVLGSSRKTSALILEKIDEAHPDKIEEWRKKYGDQLSGTYEKEYRHIIKSEQREPGRPAPSTR